MIKHEIFGTFLTSFILRQFLYRTTERWTLGIQGPITASVLSLDPILGVAVVEYNVGEVESDCGKGGLTSKIKFTNDFNNRNIPNCFFVRQIKHLNENIKWCQMSWMFHVMNLKALWTPTDPHLWPNSGRLIRKALSTHRRRFYPRSGEVTHLNQFSIKKDWFRWKLRLSRQFV